MCECVTGACKHHLEGHAETRDMSGCSGLTLLPPPKDIHHHASCPADMLGCSDFSGHCAILPLHCTTQPAQQVLNVRLTAAQVIHGVL
jgi:hypothetical protein